MDANTETENHQINDAIKRKKSRRIAKLVNDVNISNIQRISKEILKENLIEGRGLVLFKEIMKSQKKFRHLSHVYAALIAIINSELPETGLLLVKRAVLKFKKINNCRNNKNRLLGISMFLAHLVNQRVVFELLAVDVVLILLGNATAANVEVAVKFFLECGSSLQSLLPCDKFEPLLEEFSRVLDDHAPMKLKRVREMFERTEFREYPAIIDELDLVEPEDQVTHYVSLLHDIHL